MAGALAQLRSLINEKFAAPLLAANGTKVNAASTNGKTGDDSLDPHPCVGFKATFNTTTNKLSVHVIGARHLPASVANIPAVAYLVKVKMFPGKDKFETRTRPESWPKFNETFEFKITPNKPSPHTSLLPVEMCLVSSKFLTLTVFALDKGDKRKSVGSVNWPLDHKQFSCKRNTAVYESAEMWKRVADLATSFGALTTSLGHKLVPRSKDQVEVTLTHTVGEIGEDDLLTLRINRLRWSIDKTKEYEHKGASLYVKMTVSTSFGQVVRCQKTLNFAPSISVHWPADDKKYSVLEASVPPVGPRNKGMTCSFTLCTKIKGKKIHLGRTVIQQCPGEREGENGHWSEAMKKPGTPITQWHNLLAVES